MIILSAAFIRTTVLSVHVSCESRALADCRCEPSIAALKGYPTKIVTCASVSARAIPRRSSAFARARKIIVIHKRHDDEHPRSCPILSDDDLLARLEWIAGKSREVTVELLAHLAALDTRAILYAAEGYGTLFAYCTEALRLSEDAACSRIAVARACRRFPVILEHLSSGAVTLTSMKVVAPHLTMENHEAVLERAKGLSVRQIAELVAEIAPRPDARTLVSRIPGTGKVASKPEPELPLPQNAAGVSAEPEPAPIPDASRRPVIQPTAPARYRVQFTVAQETHDKLRRLQGLLRREIPDGDAGEIVSRALDLLLDKIERTKLGAVSQPAPHTRPSRPPENQPENAIRLETDEDIRTPLRPSRYIPREVRREAWHRDGGRCAFVAATGRRCSETTYLELHHVHAYAKGGPSTLQNISLRCRRHNQYESDLVFCPARRHDGRAANEVTLP
jgi:5-methylcytosine-specific restriction endonuclease McrA